MINLEENLRQHEVTEALELDSIEWFREEIGELQRTQHVSQQQVAGGNGVELRNAWRCEHAAITTPPEQHMRSFPPRFGEECQDRTRRDQQEAVSSARRPSPRR